jgi:hypothetical protein
MRQAVIPRLLTKSAAAAYCGISIGIFDRLRPARAISLQKGHDRLERYDVVDLDRWIESLKGLPAGGAEKWLERLGTGGRDDDRQDARA